MASAVGQAETARRTAATLGACVVILCVAAVFAVLGSLAGEWLVVGYVLSFAVGVGGVVAMVRRGHQRAAALGLSLAVTLGILLGAVVYGDAAYAPFFLLIGVMLAGLTLSPADVAVVSVTGLACEGALTALPTTLLAVRSIGGMFPEASLLYAITSAVAIASSASVSRLVAALEERARAEEAATARAEGLVRQLEQSQRMESLGRLAGGVAHDVNNLLTVMQSCASLAEAQLPEGHPARLDLVELDDAIRRGAALTRQLLAFSRQAHVQTERVDLVELVRSMEDLLRKLVGAGVTIEAALGDSPCPVQGAAAELQQVVMNLVVNAGDAMDGTGPVRLALVVGEGVCRLRVEDEGPGVPAELRGRIFEPFFTTKTGRGTGLGLSTVYGIVTRLGGRIAVTDRVGGGAAFEVELPLVSEQVAAPQAAPAPRGRRVFVVDDEAQVQRQMARVLEQAGFLVHAYASAEQLLTDGTAPAPDVLVTDVNLSGQSGFALAEQVLASRPDVRVVVVSGFVPDPTATERLVRRGAVFLPKPFAPAALIDAVSPPAARSLTG